MYTFFQTAVNFALLARFGYFFMFLEAEMWKFRFFNFSTLLTWIFHAESELSETNFAQIRNFHCLDGKIVIEIMSVDCIFATTLVPVVSKTV